MLICVNVLADDRPMACRLRRDHRQGAALFWNTRGHLHAARLISMTPLDVLEAGRTKAPVAPVRADSSPATPKTFVWGRHFETGIGSVDDQHRRLVELINRLADSFVVDAPERTHTVQAVFDRLVEYAREHFGDEETLMRNESLCPDYIDHHCRVHRDFSTQLELLWASRNAMREAREVLLGFLVAWLGFHILGEDHVMAMQIEAIRGGMHPDAAYQRVRARADLDRGTHALIDAVQSLYHALSLQNHSLAEANIRLEERVSERTRELDVSNAALRDAYRNMENLARTDGLLAIANRRHFEERLELEWQRALRERQPLAILMIDVDYFKRFNDYYGHQAGDSCLRAIAESIAHNKRATDLLARYGGEELVLLLPNTSLAGAQRLAGIACAGVERAEIIHAASPVSDHVTVSIGVASLVPDSRGHPADLIATADRALYGAKQGGRNQIAVATEH
jgi:hemerythrin